MSEPRLDRESCAPVLVFGIGNPSRGDDALGPLLAERLERIAPSGVEVLTDFQLQVEHALELRGRRSVVFADASLDEKRGVSLDSVAPGRDASYSSHALSPAMLLFHYRELFGTPPAAFVLAIRGYEFDLGAPLSAGAARNLESAIIRLREFLEPPDP